MFGLPTKMPLARAAGSGRSGGHSMVLVQLAWATMLGLVCRAGGAGAPEGARRRRLQWKLGYSCLIGTVLVRFALGSHLYVQQQAQLMTT